MAEKTDKQKSDFTVFKEMIDSGNKGIRSTSQIIKCDLKKNHGEITFAVDKEAFQDVIKGRLFNEGHTHYCIMYVIEKKEFDKLKDSK